MATDIRTAELKTPVALAEYLFRRLHQLGVRGVHGVPGDFNLVISSLLIIYTSILAAKYYKGSSGLHPSDWAQLGWEHQ